MDSPATNLTTPDARGLSAQPAAAAMAGAGGATPGLGAPGFGSLDEGLSTFGQRVPFVSNLRGNPRLPLMIAAALALALLVGLWLWSRAPDYRVLFSNLSDRDGGAIITALQQMNVPYKLADAGGAILVPSDQVHEVRLRLASQGLPKSGSVGFELMDNQKFGISQFAEQVNYQRSLEGELERTIEAISAVQSARVHLAIPKPSVFVREEEPPSASVLVNLYPGRVLDDGQVAAIARLVSSSVPNLAPKSVTIVDQDGNLLTQPASGNGLDASQLKYVQQVERNTRQRIDAILAPLFGAGNVRSQVSADIDFSHSEQTQESYGPNGNPQAASVRSQQTSEATDTAQANSGGVPGALSNQPPQPASAPLVAGPAGAAGAAAGTTPVSQRKDETTNYELDKTVRHIEDPTGGIRRLSVAVVVNYQRKLDAKGHLVQQPLPADKLAQIDQLVKDAMGYDAKRGDSVNVVNDAFDDPNAYQPIVPWWKQRETIELGEQAAKYLAFGIAGLFVYFKLLKPLLRKPDPVPVAETPLLPDVAGDETALLGDERSAAEIDALVAEGDLTMDEAARLKFERNLEYARSIAKDDPKLVAMVIKSWVSDER
jgi:flagellar M-ring protein FliF